MIFYAMLITLFVNRLTKKINLGYIDMVASLEHLNPIIKDYIYQYRQTKNSSLMTEENTSKSQKLTEKE